MLDSARLQPAITAAAPRAAQQTLKEVREQAERAHIERTLTECGGVVAKAAKVLGIGLSTLYGRMKDLGVG